MPLAGIAQPISPARRYTGKRRSTPTGRRLGATPRNGAALFTQFWCFELFSSRLSVAYFTRVQTCPRQMPRTQPDTFSRSPLSVIFEL